MNDSDHKMLNTGALIFVGVTLLVMFLQYIAGPGYKASNTEVLANAGGSERWMLPHQFRSIIENDQLQNYLLVDLRPREEFNQGSLPGAVNIPFENLLETKSMKSLKTNQPVLLFSGREAQSSVAGLLLYGEGFSNVFVLANNYSYIKDNVLGKFEPSTAFTHEEKARYDYHRFFKATPKPSSQPAASQPKIIETQVVSVEGGC
ncbi:MAG: rhodanese-like domain-containing protein [Bacteroidales bacterium]|nr:rhodanese-like domain-containing protein [Bacteroidales bacterium]